MTDQTTSVKTDWKFIAVIAVAAIFISSVPYLYAYVTTPRDLVFLGAAQNGPDSGEYLAWMRESMRGLFISNTLTPEANPPAFFNLVFWILGRLALYTGMTLAQAYQVLRIVSNALFCVATYWFCSLVLPNRTQTRIAFLLIVFGSGFSFFITLIEKVIGEIHFPDQFTSEGTTLYSMVGFPLLIWGAALFTGIFALTLRAYATRRLRYAVIAGAMAFVLGWSHGYDLILIYGVLAAFSLIVVLRDGFARHWIATVAIIGGMSIVGPLYMVYLTRTHPTWKEALGQFVNAGVFSPDPLQMIWLLGLPLILAFVTFDGFTPVKSRDANELFTKTWFGVALFLIYLPVEYQIHFINGWQIPIAILTTRGLFDHILPWVGEQKWLFRFVRERKPATLALLFVLLTAPTGFYFVGWRVLDLSRHQLPFFINRDQAAAIEWLDKNGSPDSVVLSSYEIGHWIPGLTGSRAFIAHWAMTLKFFEKRDMVERFFDPAYGDGTRMTTLQQYGVRYVFWSDAERKLGAWNPENANFLEPVFATPRAVVYRVKTAMAFNLQEFK